MAQKIESKYFVEAAAKLLDVLESFSISILKDTVADELAPLRRFHATRAWHARCRFDIS